MHLEGLGTSLLDAMAFGLPIVATAEGSVHLDESGHREGSEGHLGLDGDRRKPPRSADWKYVGNPIKAIIPGVGVIMQDAGLQLYDHGTQSYIKIVGTYQWNLNDFEEFCAAMQ